MKNNDEEKEENDGENGKETKPKKRKFSKKSQKSKKKSKPVEVKSGASVFDDTDNAASEKQDEKVDETKFDGGRNTLPRTRRSRSTSGRRSFKDLFHRSSKPRLKKERSQSTGELDYDEGKASSINLDDNTYNRGLEFNNADYTKFDPILQPRDRLKYMTVRDALREKNTRKSPIRGNIPFENKERTSSRGSLSSSLPDLANPESINTIPSFIESSMRKSRLSRSAEFQRDTDRNTDGLDVKKEENIVDSKSNDSKENCADDICGSQNGIKNESNISDLMSKDQHRLTDRIQSYPFTSYGRPQSVSPSRNSASKSRDPSPMAVSQEELSDTEKQRRESFSKFLKLSKTLPQYGISSLSRLRRNDSTEESQNVLDSIKEKSPVTEKMSTTGHENNESPALPDLPLMGTAEKLELGNKPADSILSNNDNMNFTDNIIRDKVKEVSVEPDVGQTVEAATTDPQNDKSEKNLLSLEQAKTRKRISRSEYKSPRRFSGRASSGGRKVKDKTREDEKDEAIDKGDERGEKVTKPEDKGAPVAISDKAKEEPSNDIPETTVASMSDTLPSRTKRQLFSSSRSRSNKGTVAKPLMSATGTQSENVPESSKSENVVSKSIQTSFESLKFDIKDIKKRNQGVQKELDDVVEKMSTEDVKQHDISEISDVDKEDSFFQAIDKNKRKPSKNSSDTSDKTGDTQDLEDIAVFKTPEGTPPSQKRKVLPPLSELKIIDAEVQRSNIEPATPQASTAAVSCVDADDADVDSPSAESETSKNKETKDSSKSKKGVSLLGIISLKRRLARQRSQREKKRPTLKNKKVDSETPSKESANEEETTSPGESKKEDNVKTQVFIENETNLSLSKLALLQETDIIDDVIEISDDPLPKKHITFDGCDEPEISDEPLEEATSRPRRGLATRRESRILEKRRKVISCCKQFIAFLFSHIGLCSLVVAYSILGGFIFQALEAPHEQKTRIRVKDERQSAITQILQLAQELKLSKHSRENFTFEVNKLLISFQTEVYKATDIDGWNNKDDTSESELQWSFASSLLFAITVMTTIGYGHVAPKTNYGRIVTIGYAVLGIPLTLLCLTNIGDLMATGFRMLYAKVCCGVCCVLFSPKKRRLPDPEKGMNTEEEVVIQGEEKSPEVKNVPTSLCILVMTAYILLGTLLFSIWESWDVITGTYFSFITLSTIGFGDVVPGTAMDQWANEQKLVLCAMYLVFGLSLIAMCFNLVQEDVKEKCRWLGAKIGIIDHSKT